MIFNPASEHSFQSGSSQRSWELIGLRLEGRGTPLIAAMWCGFQGFATQTPPSLRLLRGTDTSNVVRVALKQTDESFGSFLTALDSGRPPSLVSIQASRIVLAFDFWVHTPGPGGDPEGISETRKVIARSTEGHVLSAKVSGAEAFLLRPRALLTLTGVRQHTCIGILALPNLQVRRGFLTALAENDPFTEAHWKLFRPPVVYEGPIIGAAAHHFFRDRLWFRRAVQTEPQIRRRQLPSGKGDAISNPWDAAVQTPRSSGRQSFLQRVTDEV